MKTIAVALGTFAAATELSSGAWSAIATAGGAIVVALFVRRLEIRRKSDTVDRQQLSDDERRFRSELLARVDAQGTRIDELEKRHSQVLADLGRATGERDAALQRATRAEAEVDRLRVRIEELEERVRVLTAQVAIQGQGPAHS